MKNYFQKIPALCLVTLPFWRQLVIWGIVKSIWWQIWPPPPSCSWACLKKRINPFFSHCLKASVGLVPIHAKKSDLSPNGFKTVDEDKPGTLATHFPYLSFLCGFFTSQNAESAVFETRIDPECDKKNYFDYWRTYSGSKNITNQIVSLGQNQKGKYGSIKWEKQAAKLYTRL